MGDAREAARMADAMADARDRGSIEFEEDLDEGLKKRRPCIPLSTLPTNSTFDGSTDVSPSGTLNSITSPFVVAVMTPLGTSRDISADKLAAVSSTSEESPFSVSPPDWSADVSPGDVAACKQIFESLELDSRSPKTVQPTTAPARDALRPSELTSLDEDEKARWNVRTDGGVASLLREEREIKLTKSGAALEKLRCDARTEGRISGKSQRQSS